MEGLNVRENVMLGVKEKQAILDRYNELAMNYSDETADEMTRLQDEIEAQNLWDLDSQVEQAMDALGCPPDDWSVDKLSGGEKRRVALCKLLLEKPELLLLDEPTNHLDAETVNWLEGHLRDYPGAILIVTHDRYFLDNVTGWILELDRGRGIPHEGNYTSYLKQKAKRLSLEKSEDASRQKQIEMEAEWMGSSPQARGRRSRRRGSSATRISSTSRPIASRRRRRSSFPSPNGSVPTSSNSTGLSKVVRRQGVDRQFDVQAAARRDRRRDRPERGRQDDAVSHDHRPGKARQAGAIAVGESVKLGYVDQSA